MIKSKKAVLFLGAAVMILAITAGSLALYIYNLDFGVNYTGRARLDYNWEYYFTDCPRESWEYDGDFLSFQYPKFQEKTPLINLGGVISSSDNLLFISWDNSIPAPSDLFILLSSFTPTSTFSPALLRWLLMGEESPELNYDVSLERVTLKNGHDHVLVFSCRSRLERPDYKVVVGVLRGAKVFKLSHKVRLNISQGRHERREHHFLQGHRPERDAQRACVLDRFLDSLEIKK